MSRVDTVDEGWLVKGDEGVGNCLMTSGARIAIDNGHRDLLLGGNQGVNEGHARSARADDEVVGGYSLGHVDGHVDRF